MKVLLINVVCGSGSTGRICTDIATELEKRGHEVRIAYGRGSVPLEYGKYAVRIGNDRDIYFHGIKARLFDACGFASKKATKDFIKWVKEFNPDVINIHNIHGYYINVEVLFDYFRASGKRIIWTLHDCWPFTGHSALCDGSDCYKWETGCGNCPQKNVYPGSFIDRSKLNWGKKRNIFTGIPELSIVVPSHWLADCVKRSFLKEYRVEVINNGVNTEIFKKTDGGNFRQKYGLESKYVILGVASSWEQMKGFEDYILLSEALDDSCRVVLIGVNENMRTSKYAKLLTLGNTDGPKELADIYSSADVFLNLTYCDTFPTVNLEARACDLPIITYDTGGSIEAAGKNIVAVRKKGDIKGIIEAIISEKGNNKRLNNKETEFDISNMQMIKAYFDILTGKRKTK